MNFTRPIFLQCTLLLLLAFSGMGAVSVFLFNEMASGQKELLQAEVVSDDAETIASFDDLEGDNSDGGGTDAFISSQSALLPVILKAPQNNIHSSRQPSVSLYILYCCFIFYHSVPHA